MNYVKNINLARYILFLDDKFYIRLQKKCMNRVKRDM